MTFNVVDDIERAAFATLNQDYPNLEIVFSDDCSTDGTYEALTRIVLEYQGPHTVSVVQTPTNLKIVEHFNTALQRTRGALIVQTNSEDYSEPYRVSRLVELWQSKPNVTLVTSPAWYVTPSGQRREVFLPFNSDRYATAAGIIVRLISAMGACNAYDRRFLEKVGPVPAELELEDRILTVRAALHGEIVQCEHPLVNVVTGGLSWAGEAEEGRLLYRERIRRWRYQNAVAVLRETAEVKFPKKMYARIFLAIYTVYLQILRSKRFGQKFERFHTSLAPIYRRIVKKT